MKKGIKYFKKLEQKLNFKEENQAEEDVVFQVQEEEENQIEDDGFQPEIQEEENQEANVENQQSGVQPDEENQLANVTQGQVVEGAASGIIFLRKWHENLVKIWNSLYIEWLALFIGIFGIGYDIYALNDTIRE